jgi:hypothetical protein
MSTEDPAWGKSVEGCRLSISLASAQMSVGDPVELKLAFKNEGQTAIKFSRISLWFDYTYLVSHQNIGNVPFTLFGQQQKRSLEAGGASAISEIEPGQELVRMVEISRLYDLSLSGKYVVEASKEIPSRSGQGLVKVFSNKAAFELVEKPR